MTAEDHIPTPDPSILADAAGAGYEGSADAGHFRLDFFGQPLDVSFPGLEVEPHSALPHHMGLLVARYVSGGDGTMPTGRWVSFAELPDGRFYARAFQGYSGDALARRFERDDEALEAAALRLGGEPIPGTADRAWAFAALPRVPVALLWWSADDEFGARAEVLFDAVAPHYLPTDGCALLGSWLTSLLVRSAG